MIDDAAMQAYHGDGMAKAASAIDLAARVKANYDESWITPNARRAVALAALHGNLHIRALADVDTKARLEGVKALLRVRDEFRGIVDVQVVAFAQDGIVREPGAASLLREAMALGADVVGGIPWIEGSAPPTRPSTSRCASISRASSTRTYRCCSTTPATRSSRTLEAMARAAIARGWEGRALAHHCRAMALYPADVRPRAGRLLLKRARVPVVSDPHTGPLHARVRELAAERGHRLPRAGRHLGRLLSVRPQQHAGGGLPRRPPPVDDDAHRHGAALRHGDRGRGARDQPRRLRPRGREAGRTSSCSTLRTCSRRCASMRRRRT